MTDKFLEDIYAPLYRDVAAGRLTYEGGLLRLCAGDRHITEAMNMLDAALLRLSGVPEKNITPRTQALPHGG